MTSYPHHPDHRLCPSGQLPSNPHTWGFSFSPLAWPSSSFSPIPSPYYYSYLRIQSQQ
jgi:hypothetical protein